MFFPITCVDNFYGDIDSVRNFALSLEYSKNELDSYPGERTNNLSIIDKNFFNLFTTKLFSLFFDLSQTEINGEIDTYFQKIYPFSCENNLDDYREINSGWSHLDGSCIFAGVIYLNPNPNLDSGTKICSLKNNTYLKDSDISKWTSIRRKFYNNSEVNLDEVIKVKREHNENFEDSAEFKNVYNRMICYDSSYWHKESNFLMKDDFRLTQVFFVKKIECKNDSLPPYLRCKQYDI